jgi:hypothetical protein
VRTGAKQTTTVNRAVRHIAQSVPPPLGADLGRRRQAAIDQLAKDLARLDRMTAADGLHSVRRAWRSLRRSLRGRGATWVSPVKVLELGQDVGAARFQRPNLVDEGRQRPPASDGLCEPRELLGEPLRVPSELPTTLRQLVSGSMLSARLGCRSATSPYRRRSSHMRGIRSGESSTRCRPRGGYLHHQTLPRR